MMRLAWLGLAALLGCGYHLSSTSTTVPAGARTIGIALFGNHTRDYGLEVGLRRALEDEFRRQGALRVVPEDEGDLVLRGDIRRLTSQVTATSGTDEAVQYQEVIRIGVRLIERESGRVLFENKLLQEAQDFGAVTGVVITSSPHFQRGTIDGRDLANMTNVQLGATRRRQAVHDLLESLAREVYQQAMEGF